MDISFSILNLSNFFPNGDESITEPIELRLHKIVNTEVREREEEYRMLLGRKIFGESYTLLSLSVGSIMSVPGTGHDIVGAWNP